MLGYTLGFMRMLLPQQVGGHTQTHKAHLASPWALARCTLPSVTQADAVHTASRTYLWLMAAAMVAAGARQPMSAPSTSSLPSRGDTGSSARCRPSGLSTSRCVPAPPAPPAPAAAADAAADAPPVVVELLVLAVVSGAGAVSRAPTCRRTSSAAVTARGCGGSSTRARKSDTGPRPMSRI